MLILQICSGAATLPLRGSGQPWPGHCFPASPGTGMQPGGRAPSPGLTPGSVDRRLQPVSGETIITLVRDGWTKQGCLRHIQMQPRGPVVCGESTSQEAHGFSFCSCKPEAPPNMLLSRGVASSHRGGQSTAQHCVPSSRPAHQLTLAPTDRQGPACCAVTANGKPRRGAWSGWALSRWPGWSPLPLPLPCRAASPGFPGPWRFSAPWQEDVWHLPCGDPTQLAWKQVGI